MRFLRGAGLLPVPLPPTAVSLAGRYHLIGVLVYLNNSGSFATHPLAHLSVLDLGTEGPKLLSFSRS